VTHSAGFGTCNSTARIGDMKYPAPPGMPGV
jgi:hypothetical protein